MSMLATIGNTGPKPDPVEDLRKLAAWHKARGVLGEPHRIDCDGRKIVWEEYGKYTDCGWQIDHILGDTDQLFNLRARHWRGNSQAGSFTGALTKHA